jgi:hypothetical protein
MSTLVWAFGSNLDPAQMKRRCPSARKVMPFTVQNAALVFRAVADVAVRDGSKVPGGIWEISAADERQMDIYEGVSSGLYKRYHFTITLKGVKRQVLFYKMNETGIMPPSHQYIDTIMRGYRYFGLDLKYLDVALAEAHNDKHKTDYLKWRFKRDRPILAKPDHIRRIIKPKRQKPEQGHLFPEPSPRYVRNIYGETRLIKKAPTEEQVWAKIERKPDPSPTLTIVKGKRKRSRSLKRGQ